MHRLTLTHAKRWHKAHGSARTGPVHQNRYTAVPVQTESHFLTVVRYVERNPVQARLVEAAEDWPWSSARQRTADCPTIPLSEWPVPRPPDWLARLNQPQSLAELQALRVPVSRGWPIGDDTWRQETAKRLSITLRGRGRPERNRVQFS